MLDDRRFRDWLELLAEDITYFMPIRRNVKFGQHAQRENTSQGAGISWFDEDKWTLTKRVDQILTGVHYAEEPLSRVMPHGQQCADPARAPSMADRARSRCAAASSSIRTASSTRPTPLSAGAPT